MSFADRLKKFTAADVTSTSPRGPLELCHPQMLLVRGHPMGLAHIELAPLLVGGAESTRILQAVLDLLGEMVHAPDDARERHVAELVELGHHLRQHIKSVSAAAELAHAEHQSLKHAAKGTLQ